MRTLSSSHCIARGAFEMNVHTLAYSANFISDPNAIHTRHNMRAGRWEPFEMLQSSQHDQLQKAHVISKYANTPWVQHCHD